MPEPRPTPIRGSVRVNEPMSRHTSWRVGGPADRYFEPADRADLLAFVRQLPVNEPVMMLGLGSNLLVRDGGVRGTVIAFHGALDELRIDAGDATRVQAEAGVHCARLAKSAQARALAGLGFMAGIPGTVGGALAMNAGAWGGETWNVVDAVEALFRDGRCEWLRPSAFAIAYRSVAPPPDFLCFLGARFAVTSDADGEHLRATRESLAKRKATQPVGRPSAGSTFRNPADNHAARLIDACGLKGHRIGGAWVSEQHANFILTDDGARAADVEQLIEHMRNTVTAKTGIALEPEVRIVGEHAHA